MHVLQGSSGRSGQVLSLDWLLFAANESLLCDASIASRTETRSLEISCGFKTCPTGGGLSKGPPLHDAKRLVRLMMETLMRLADMAISTLTSLSSRVARKRADVAVDAGEEPVGEAESPPMTGSACEDEQCCTGTKAVPLDDQEASCCMTAPSTPTLPQPKQCCARADPVAVDVCCKSTGQRSSQGQSCCAQSETDELPSSPMAAPLATISHNGSSASPLPPLSIKVFYGSQGGRAEATARRFAAQCTERFSSTTVMSLAEYDPEDLFTEHAVCVYFVSTQGEGAPPANGKWFFQWLEDVVLDFRVQRDALAHLRYAVFGLGDAAYGSVLFNRAGRQLHEWLRALGGQHVCPMGVGDDSAAAGVVEVAADWTDGCLMVLDQVQLHGHVPANIPSELHYESDAEEEEEDANGGGIGDLEDLAGRDALTASASAGKRATRSERADKPESATKEMVTPALKAALTKQGYKVIGTHSGVKLCRWTKSMLRGRGGCYKHSFYGIESHRCMETTPSLACANKCVFCWRHHTNPVGTEWRWKTDAPETIVNGALDNHRRMIRELRGVPGLDMGRFEEALQVRHCALSLVGEPIMYPWINEFVALLHAQRISSFLVTNAQFPDRIAHLSPVTQLYVSVDAATPEALKAVDRPLFADYWDRFLACLDELAKKRQRTVFRLTLVKGFNESDLERYAELIRRGRPEFVEVKGVTFCGYSGSNPLTMANVPFHQEVVAFVLRLTDLVRADGYELACEHEHSCSLLLASTKFRVDGRWHTWIDYERFHQLLATGTPFTSLDYMQETPQWAVYGDAQHGFDPQETRFFRKKGAKEAPVEHGC